MVYSNPFLLRVTLKARAGCMMLKKIGQMLTEKTMKRTSEYQELVQSLILELMLYRQQDLLLLISVEI
jgi:hypothetical protein